MLTIYYGDMPKAIYDTATYFDNQYEGAWITTPFAKEIIKDIDKSVVLGEQVISSPVLGSISVRSLSGGVKTLLLVENLPKRVFNASTCGDNCAKWLLKIGEEKDVTINLRHMMNFGKGDFTIYVKNNRKIVHNMAELMEAAGDFVWGGS